MKFLLLFSLLFLSADLALAQNERKSVFDQKLQSSFEEKENSDQYVAVGLEKKGENAVFVRMGFFGFKGSFKIEITPISIVNGKESRLEPVSIETLAELDPKVISKPTALIPNDQNIDSVEVIFKFSSGEKPRIIVPFKYSEPTFGELFWNKKRAPEDRTPR